MSLLDRLNQIGSVITGFANKIPGIAPGEAPRTGMEGIADPDMLRIAQQARERRYRAAYQQAARNGAQWYELGDAAGAAADEGYLPEVAQAAQVGQQRQEMTRREARRAEWAATVNGLAELSPQRRAALQMMEPEQGATALFGDNQNDRFKMTALGDGAVSVLDGATGVLSIRSMDPSGKVTEREVKQTVKNGDQMDFYDKNGNLIRSVPAGKSREILPSQMLDAYESFERQVKPYAEYARYYDQLEQLAGMSGGASDIALVIAFNKMLDPNSVVRETEFKTAAEVGGLRQRAEAALLKLQNGEFLAPSVRREFLEVARGLYEDAKRRFEPEHARKVKILAPYLDPNLLYNPFERGRPGAGAPPPAGAARPKFRRSASDVINGAPR